MSSLNTFHYNFVYRQAASDALIGRKRDFSKAAVESDGRKQNAIVRQLFDRGLIESYGDKGNYIITDAAYRMIDAEVINLQEEWEKNGKHAVTELDFDPKFDLIAPFYRWPDEFAKIKFVAENAGSFLWYVLDDGPLKYSVNRYTPNAGEEASANGSRWYGPMTLPQAQEKMREWFKSEAGKPNFYNFPVLAFTHQAVVDYVASYRQQQRINKAFAENIAWGLQTLGILDETEGKQVASNEFGGLVMRQTTMNFGENPELWDSRLHQNIETNEKVIAAATENLRILHKIEEKVKEFGGWNKFREEYLAHLTQELKTRK